MAFNENAGGQITLAEGAALTQKYRDLNPDGIKARYFGKDCINTLLNQDGGSTSKGIRMYFGTNDLGEQEIVMVGVDANGDDLLDVVMDLSGSCPKDCPKPNVLNGLSS